MKLWISGEVYADIADEFRVAILEVERRVNDVLADRDYALPLESWDVIAVIRNDSVFTEITKYSRKKRDMDFRLVIDHAEFKSADANQRKSLICDMLLRSLDLLEAKGVSVERLRNDFREVAASDGWL
jgi:hypothetical protein